MTEIADFTIDMNSCRICLSTKKPLCPLFRYKLSGNYAEMLTAIADVKVASNDGLPDKICSKCCTSLEKAFLVKTVAERSDKILRKKLERIKERKPTKKIAFDSLTDIKSEIGPLTVKSEPKWEMEIEVLANENGVVPTIESKEMKDIVIANTVIRKVEPHSLEDNANNFFGEDFVDISWKSIKPPDAEYLEDDFFNNDDDDDDYIPPTTLKVKHKNKFKKPKLSEIKVFKEKKKPLVKKIKVLRKSDIIQCEEDIEIKDGDEKPGTLITCYPIMKNGCRGPPILLKRPKDATILKVHPNYKPRKNIPSSSNLPRTVTVRDKPVRLVRTTRPAVVKQKEKMVCPVCGILTYTLGNHMTTHQDKKRYSCPQCPRSFAQKGNLLVHIKQHSGVKDHICEICGAGFYCQKSLMRHNLIHKGERPFGCNLCAKKFIARCDLNRHLRIHSGYKPFKCNTCTMSFNAKHQLQNHERMHTGERPYSCQVCNLAFSYKVNLNNHVFKTHGINLKFKSIHTVTEEVLQREQEMMGPTRIAISHILPGLGDVPPPAAHETVPHHSNEHYIV